MWRRDDLSLLTMSRARPLLCCLLLISGACDSDAGARTSPAPDARPDAAAPPPVADAGLDAGATPGEGGPEDSGTTTDAGSPDAAMEASDAGPPRARCRKRGLGYGYHSKTDLSALSRAVGWWYNWAPQPDEGVRKDYATLGVEFVPMVWGGQFDSQDTSAKIPKDAAYLLGFNEPNFFAQANLTPKQAADLWPRLEQIATQKGLELVSPAVNFCGGGCTHTDPFKYLDDFFAACTGCRIDYIAAHWYACTGDALEWYLGQLEKYGKPIWLTEFSCGDGDDRSLATQKRYMTEAVAILENRPSVFRYAWFAGRTDAIPNVDLLGEDGQLTELGQLYVSLPANEECSP
jgi:hypothetical protein